MAVRRVALAAVTLATLATFQVAGQSAQGTANSAGIDPVRASTVSPFANCLPAALKTTLSRRSVNLIDSYVNAEVEPRVAVSPRLVGGKLADFIGVWQQDRWIGGGARGIVAGYSFDGGRSWATVPLPFTACSPGGVPAEAASDPWVSIGPDGTAYAVALTLSVSTPGLQQGIVAATSIDGGRTWGNVRMVVRDSPTELSDKESVTADPVRPGVAYLVWDRTGTLGGEFAQPPWFSRTVDWGRTWSKTTRIPTVSGLTIGNEIVVDPRTDTLYDFFSRVAASGHAYCEPEREDCNNPNELGDIAVVRSDDQGATWSRPVIIAHDRATGPGVTTSLQVRTGTLVPEATIDPHNGMLSVVWQDSRFDHGRYDRIAISSSRDGGWHWSAPRQVRSPGGEPAVTAAIAIDRSGRIAVTYYTIQPVSEQGGSLAASYWFTSSGAGGRTFSPPRKLAGPFSLLFAPFSRGFFLGDYMGLAAAGNDFESLFVKVNPGDIANRTDVYSARVGP